MTERIAGPTPSAHAPEHLVQVYRETSELAAAASHYLAAGLGLAQPAVVVATAAHRHAIAAALDRLGWDVDALSARGMLLLADAEETLATILDEDGKPSYRRFTGVIGTLLDRADEAAPGASVRVVGEMVDVLTRAGKHAEADALEGLWNRLGAHRRFSLLCAYRVEPFDRDTQLVLMPSICRSHSRMLPLADGDRVERALDAALVAELGETAALKVWAHARKHTHSDAIPVAQAALLWLSSHMPRAADRVLAGAQSRFAAA